MSVGTMMSTAVMIRMILDCRRYARMWKPWVRTSAQVIKPRPPMMMSSMMTVLTTGLNSYVVREPPPAGPIISKPALQKAEMAWNIAYHQPVTQPYCGAKTVYKSSVPTSSMMATYFRMKSTSWTMPLSCGAASASCMVLRCMRPILRPEKTVREMAAVTTPRPPT